MFENHFGFIRRPFTAAPDCHLFVASEPARTAFESIDQCLRGGQGIAVLTAPVGTGKTMLCQKLIQGLEDDYTVSFVPSPGSSSCLGLLQAIFFGLGNRVRRKHAGLSDCEMRQELVESARTLQVESLGVVVVVDEAHLLTSEQFEELRILNTFCERGRPLMRTLLCGDAELEERLLSPSLKSLGQRIRCQTYLNSLTRAESEEFIQEQLSKAGAQHREVFTADAIQRIVHTADGVQRCLNQLCDESLSIAARDGVRCVTLEIVNRALERLVQLPLTWNCTLESSVCSNSTAASTQDFFDESTVSHPASPESDGGPKTDSAVVEFGSLDDEPLSQQSEEFSEPADAIDSGSQSDADTLFIDIGPLVEDDQILVEEPQEADGEIDSELEEQLRATFRQGLADAPVRCEDEPMPADADVEEDFRFTEEPVLDRYSTATSNEAVAENDDVIERVEDFGGIVPRFDAAVAPEDLLPETHRRSESEGRPMMPAACGDAGAEVNEVADQWSDSAQAQRVIAFEADTSTPTVEEQLLSSCIETRREIASMLDSLESHVSESLADRYDVVMPDDHQESVAAQEMPVFDDPAAVREKQINDRLKRVVEVERSRR